MSPREELESLRRLAELEAKAAQPPARGAGDELARQGGLTARYAVEGPLGAAASIIGDPAATAANWGIRGINAMGGNLPEFGMPSQALPKLLDRTGVKPETPGEEVVGAFAKGLSGASPFLKAAQMAPQAVQSIPLVRSMLAKPVTELMSAGVGGGASEATKQMGGGTTAQLLAGALAPMGLGAVAGGAKAVAGAVNEVRRPLTQKGAEQVAADTLGRFVQDRTTALANLDKFNKLGPGVPGSMPTAAAAAGDYGLAGAQQAIMRGDNAPSFAVRGANNNEARIADLAKLGATDEMLAKYAAKREAATAPLREAAFANSNGPVDYGRVEGLINALRNSPAGGKQETARALDTLKQWVAQRKAEGRVRAEDAYSLHQDINDLIRGRVNDDKGAIRLSAGMATSVKKELADVIEEVAPGFNKYLEKYSRLSKPIDRLEIIKDKLGGQELSKVTNAMPQVTADGASFTLSQAKLRNQLSGIKGETTLAPRQSDILERVLGDLNAETFAARAGKQPGSDTYQNMASANFVNRVLGTGLAESGVGRAVRGPLNLLNRPFESRVNDIVQKAFEDPKEMERLLKKARASRQSQTLTGLLSDAVNSPRISGGLLGALVQ